MTPAKVYDEGAFTVDKGEWGYQSFDRDGNKIILSLEEDQCVYWTRRWLKAQQDGEWPEGSGRVVNKGIVGGKL